MSSGKQKTHLMRLRERKCHRSPLPSSPLAVPSTSAGRRDEAQPPIFRRQDKDSVAAAIATAASPPRTLPRPSRSRQGGPPQLQPNRPCRMFKVCVDLYAVYENVRQDFLENFTCNDLITYVVAVERFEEPVEGGATHQLLAFLEFRTPLLVSELSEACRNIFDGLQIDVQSCHSRRNCIVTISKSDDQLLFNCWSTKLSFNYQARHWAAKTPRFEIVDPFVVTHRKRYNFLRRFHAERRLELETKNVCLMPYDVVFDVPWANVVVQWWNRRIGIDGHKERQLFLRGPTNVGKTILVERMIGRKNMPGVLYPDRGRFAFQSLDERWHKVIFIDQFALTNYHAGTLRRLLAGECFRAPVKRAPDKVIRFRGPIIIIASDDTRRAMDDGLLNQLLVVEADVPYWVMSPGRHLQEKPIKTEPGEDENVLEVAVVSSEERENDV